MQEISALTLVLNEKCNFSCPYCPQHKGKNTLKIEDIKTFLDFLQPRLAKEVWLGFYGGEPLLSWPVIEKTVAHLRKSRAHEFRYTLTSNGSLLKKKHILFLKENRFELVFSYDGRAQKNRDPGSAAAVKKALANLQKLYPNGYTINSVFTPQTVPLLTASLEKMLWQGHSRLQYTLDMISPWRDSDLSTLEEQLNRLAISCRKHRQKTGKMPLENFKDPGSKGIFACFAGRDRLALLPDHTVWGCYLFYDLLGHDRQSPDYAKYCFGKLGDLAANFEPVFSDVTANYSELRQDYFFTTKQKLCSLCPDLENCVVCPAVAALATGTLAVIPGWTCELKKIGRRARARFAAAPTGRSRSRQNAHA